MKQEDELSGGCVVAAAIFALVFVAGMVCGGLLARAQGCSPTWEEFSDIYTATAGDKDAGYRPAREESDSTYTAPMGEAAAESGKTADDWESVTATAYCPCRACCGEWADKRPVGTNGEPAVIGAGGQALQQGVSIAADPAVYPLGTLVEIEGMGVYTVQDVGGAIRGAHIDVYFEQHEDALAFGVKTVRVRRR